MKITICNCKLIIVLLLSFVVSVNTLYAQEEFPYQLKKTDYIILPVGIATYSLAVVLESKEATMTFDELLQLNSADINSFDRSAINNWNQDLDQISNVGKYALLASPGLMLLPQIKAKNWNNVVTYSVMYFETAMLNVGVTELSKALAHRVRPYLYGDNLTIEKKTDIINNEEVYDSFFSGHTSAAFSSAVFLSKTYTDIYGKSTWSKVIWVSSLSLASTVGYLRYESGQHFPTDIIAGAIVGSTIGYLIPELHKKSKRDISLSVLPYGLYMTYKF